MKDNESAYQALKSVDLRINLHRAKASWYKGIADGTHLYPCGKGFSLFVSCDLFDANTFSSTDILAWSDR
jgi:hypothetical protein